MSPSQRSMIANLLAQPNSPLGAGPQSINNNVVAQPPGTQLGGGLAGSAGLAGSLTGTVDVSQTINAHLSGDLRGQASANGQLTGNVDLQQLVQSGALSKLLELAQQQKLQELDRTHGSELLLSQSNVLPLSALTNSQSRMGIHGALRRYQAGQTVAGVAEIIYDYYRNAAFNRRLSQVEVVNELATNPKLLTALVTGNSQAESPVSVYKKVNGVITPITGVSQSDPMVLIAKAADMLTTNYQVQDHEFQRLVAPGTWAFCHGSDSINDGGNRMDDTLVVIVANRLEVDSAFSRVTSMLTKPHYYFVMQAEGVIDGLPIGTGRICDPSTQGCITGEVKSNGDSKEKKVKSFIEECPPRWQYSMRAKKALIDQIITCKSRNSQTGGSVMHNLMGSVTHDNLVQEHQSRRQVVNGPLESFTS